MTFIAAFYSFTIELNHSDRGVFTTFRIKVPRHELESREHLYARLIAYCHSYRLGIYFTDNTLEPREATIEERDTIGTLNLWAQVGTPQKRMLELSLKQSPDAEHRVYFYRPDDVTTICHHLRGSKTNWVDKVLFYKIAPELLARLIEHDSSSPIWNLSFIDDRIYLTTGDLEVESELLQIDIWVAFQNSLTIHQNITGKAMHNP